MSKSIYSLGLGEVTDLSDNSEHTYCQCRRVPGGWIFTEIDRSNNIGSSVFVPFDTEFLKKEKAS